jgi:hypothetical protein
VLLDLHCIRDRLNGISETFADEKEFISTLYKMVDTYRAAVLLTVCISKFKSFLLYLLSCNAAFDGPKFWFSA